LKIPDLQPVNQMKLNLRVTGKDGAELEEEIYLTINKVPGKDLPDMKTLTIDRAGLWKQKKK
ncbi:MAG: hypothetical protein AAF514_14165, partial [Verrucomicrobiota bacterium]